MRKKGQGGVLSMKAEGKGGTVNWRMRCAQELRVEGPDRKVLSTE